MIKAAFKINGNEYAFKDITLRTYYTLKKILENPDKGSEFEIVEVMTGCPVGELKKLKFPDWLMVWEEAQLQAITMSQTTEAIRPTVEFNGIKYGLPKVEDLTIGEFADLDLLMSGDSAETKMAEIAAILYRPILKQKGNTLVLEPYDSDKYKERLEAFQDFPISGIKSANTFFLQSANSLLKSTAESLVKKSQKQNSMSPEGLEALQSLLQQDPGGALSIQLQGKILSDLTKLPSSQFDLPLIGLLGKRTKIGKWLNKFKK